MGIDISHLVSIALRDTDYEIVDDGLDGSESCDILARAVVDLNRDFFLRREGEADCEVGKIFCQFA